MQDYNLLYLLTVAVNCAFALILIQEMENSVKTVSKQNHKKMFSEGS